jgi:hypothetical protein
MPDEFVIPVLNFGDDDNGDYNDRSLALDNADFVKHQKQLIPKNDLL